MPLEFQKMPIVLRGLSEHQNPKTEVPGALRSCENAVFPKAGRIDKRRGYRLVSSSTDTHGEDIDPRNLYVNVAHFRDQLVIVGYDTVLSLVGTGSSVFGADLVRRGPTLRGNVHVTQIVTAPHTENRP
jgi:hypothetical protein